MSMHTAYLVVPFERIGCRVGARLGDGTDTLLGYGLVVNRPASDTPIGAEEILERVF